MLTGRSGSEDFDDGTFVMRAYCWWDGDTPAPSEGCPPNFVRADTGVSLCCYE